MPGHIPPKSKEHGAQWFRLQPLASECPGLKSRSCCHMADLLNGLSLIFLIFKMGMIIIILTYDAVEKIK